MSAISAAGGGRGRAGKPDGAHQGTGRRPWWGDLVTPKRRAGEDGAGAAAALASRAAWRAPGTGRVRTVLVTPRPAPAVLFTFLHGT